MSEPSDLEHVRAVLDTHRQDLLVAPHVVGVGIGKEEPSGSSYVIAVYLNSPEGRSSGPVSIEGVPVRYVVTGPLEPQ
jgi:hypothetical protein